MSEDTSAVLARYADKIGHVQVADPADTTKSFSWLEASW
jgi:hypothetical protein